MAKMYGIVNVQGHRMDAVRALQDEAKAVNGRRNSHNYIRPDMTAYNFCPPDKNGVVYDCKDWEGRIKKELKRHGIGYTDRSIVMISGVYTASPEFWADKFETVDGTPLASRICDADGNEVEIEREFSRIDKRYHIRYYVTRSDGAVRRLNEEELVRKYFRRNPNGSETEVPFHENGRQLVRLNKTGMDFWAECIEFHKRHFGTCLDFSLHIDESSLHGHAQSVPLMTSTRVASYAKDQKNNLLEIVHYDSRDRIDGEETTKATNWTRFFYKDDVKDRDGKIVIPAGTECFTPKRGKNGKLVRRRVKVRDANARPSLQGAAMIGYRAELSELQTDFEAEVGRKFGLRRGKSRYDEAHPGHAAITQSKVNESIDRAYEDAERIREETDEYVRRERRFIEKRKLQLQEERERVQDERTEASRQLYLLERKADEMITLQTELRTVWSVLETRYAKIYKTVRKQVADRMAEDPGYLRRMKHFKQRDKRVHHFPGVVQYDIDRGRK